MQVGDKYRWYQDNVKGGTIYTIIDLPKRGVTVAWNKETSRLRTEGTHTYNSISKFKHLFSKIPTFKDYLCWL